ncbi:MdtB1: multidrug resistance protein, AcrB/AcrD/AcrF family [Desulfosarcina variabilis str. Montpellier]|uniref:efflux RND transporter permease subunit n=1 Tax=Desulfosarcina variabilis TaxID=2300 RepID=UPI003AFA88AF
MRLPEFSVKYPVAAMMLFLALGLIGAYSAVKLSVDMYPDMEPPVVSIITMWPGASASDVETEITEVIEDHVNSVNNLETLTSKSLDNLSVVACRFAWGADLDVAAADIRDKLEIAKRELPDDADPPIPFKFSSATAPVLFITVTADKNWSRLFHYADKEIGDSLKRVPGVGAVIINGGLRRRFNVYFDRHKIEGFHLSLAHINAILDAENRNIPAGNIKTGDMDYFVRIPARYQTVQEIRETVVGNVDGRPIYLRDVAQVTDGFAPLDQNAWGDGKKGLVMILQKQAGRNTVTVIQAVKKRLAELSATLPPDLEINIVSDTSESIINSIANLRASLYYGIGLIVMVSLIFLRRLRTVFIIVLIIPASLIISFFLIYAFGYTINLVTLMSLAIASGMVVDNGIVVLENIVRHIEKGSKVSTAAMFGASEMGLAITASTLTTVVIFVPLMFLTGLAGIVFKPLGFVLTATLMASLLVSLMLTPMLVSKWIKTPGPDNADTVPPGLAGRFFHASEAAFKKIDDAYARILDWSLTHSMTVIILAVVVFASGISLVPFLSTSFLPKIDNGDVSVRFRLPEGSRIEETDAMVEALLGAVDKVVQPEEMRHNYAYDGEDKMGFGIALGFDQGPNVGTIGLKLVDRDRRGRSVADVAAALRQAVAGIPGLDKIEVSIESTVDQALTGGTKPVSLEIQGSDLKENISFAEAVKTELEKIRGLEDVNLSQKSPRPEIWVQVDRQKAAALGLATATIGLTLRNYLYGVEATQVRDAGEGYDLYTRFSEADKNRLDQVAHLPIFTVDGRLVPLGNVARIERGFGPIEIQHKNRQRIVKVEADLYGLALGQANARIRSVLATMAIPPGISVAFGGDAEEQGKAFADLTALLIIGILLVYMLMASLFGNLRDPFIIMFAVPFAFTGVIYAFYLTGTTLGIISFMGVVMLMGIVVNNAIVLLDYIHLLQKRSRPLREAVVQAGHDRLRPVLMTTLTTFFGMLPMAVSSAVGAEAWNPLGITMLGGLSVSTGVTLVLVPTIYYLFEKRKTGSH